MSTIGMPWHEPVLDIEGDSDDQHTPQWLLDLVAELWPGGIGTDPCWSPTCMVKARVTYDGRSAEQDGLAQPWSGNVWCNPPYSDPTPWADRMALHCPATGHEGLFLVNVSTTVRWFRRWRPRSGDGIAPPGRPARSVVFFDRRISFLKNGVERRGNDREQMLLFWGEQSRRSAFRRVFGRVGWVVP